MPKKNTVYDVDRLARFFGVTPDTVRDWCKKGKLPAFKIGKEWKVRVADLQKLIDRKITARPADKTPRLFS